MEVRVTTPGTEETVDRGTTPGPEGVAAKPVETLEVEVATTPGVKAARATILGLTGGRGTTLVVGPGVCQRPCPSLFQHHSLVVLWMSSRGAARATTLELLEDNVAWRSSAAVRREERIPSTRCLAGMADHGCCKEQGQKCYTVYERKCR